MRIVRSRLALILLAISALTTVAGCTTNPATGKSQFNAMSQKEEVSLGADASPKFVKEYGGEVPSASLIAYVSKIGNDLAAVCERPTLPWEFHVVDSAVINAFALPGGKVFMSRGLLAKMTNEAQLAGVLGHEIGHVTAKHINDRMVQQMSVQVLAAGIGIAGQATKNDYLTVLGVGAQAGGGLYLLKFGRDQESESDSLGLRYMTRLGYSPLGQLQVMQILKRESGAGGNMEILSTHPLPDTRIKRVQEIIQKTYPDAENPGKYRTEPERFKANVLDVLAKLPPPKHK